MKLNVYAQSILLGITIVMPSAEAKTSLCRIEKPITISQRAWDIYVLAHDAMHAYQQHEDNAPTLFARLHKYLEIAVSDSSLQKSSESRTVLALAQAHLNAFIDGVRATVPRNDREIKQAVIAHQSDTEPNLYIFLLCLLEAGYRAGLADKNVWEVPRDRQAYDALTRLERNIHTIKKTL